MAFFVYSATVVSLSGSQSEGKGSEVCNTPNLISISVPSQRTPEHVRDIKLAVS